MKTRLKILVFFVVFLLKISFYNAEGFVPCRSITLRGTVTHQQIAPIRNCTLILGYLRIINARFIDFISNNTTNTTIEPLFPNITEISDYFLVFQAHHITNLAQITPRLSVIHGTRLFRSSFALVLFLSPSLTHVNLGRLVSIRQGTVFLSRLYHVCYVSTVDWSALLNSTDLKRQQFNPLGELKSSRDDDNGPASIKTNLINRNCVGQVCLAGAKHCWMDRVPQIVCGQECTNGCNLDTPNRCCSDSACHFCSNTTNNSTQCVTCSSMRDIKSGKCVSECAQGQLSLSSRFCISTDECRSRSFYTLSDKPECVSSCPPAYSTHSHNFTCIRCPDGVCKRDCRSSTFHLKRAPDLDSIRNCVRVKRLTIEIETSSVSLADLSSALAYLEHIDDYLLVTRNRFLTSLEFLARLKSIGGEELFERKYALFVHTNLKLRSLWTLDDGLVIAFGGVKFFENPRLCYQHAEKFVMGVLKASQRDDLDVELSYSYNGYKSLSCSNRTLEVWTRAEKGHIDVEWEVEISDLRRLKGFQIGYSEVNTKSQEDRLLNDDDDDNDENSDGEDSTLDQIDDQVDLWTYLYVPYSQESIITRRMKGRIDVRPFTKYALFVKADLMAADTNWANRSSAFEHDKVISRVVRITSLPAQPSRVESIDYEPISFDEVNLKWRPPKYPNGIVEFYFISYTRLKDMEKLDIPNGDNCQFDRYLIDNTYEIKTTTSTVSTTTVKSNSSESGNCRMSQSEPNHSEEKANDEEKNDIISVEDDIYNLAFKPAKNPRLMTTSKKSMSTTNSSITTTTKGYLNSTSLPTTTQSQNITKLNITDSELLKYIDINESLLRLVRQDLYVQDDEKFYYTRTSNETFNLTIGNLTSFGRYIVSIIACQNFTNDLLAYTKRRISLSNTNYSSLDDIGFLIKSLSSSELFSPVSSYCSKSSLITFRSLPDQRLDEIESVQLATENNVNYFKWTRPKHPNGFIYKYNLKFIDVNLNKTQGPLCHPSLDNLKVALNQFLLTEGHVYLIQVQAVSTAGAGPWSMPTIRYHVPSLSQYYWILAFQVSGALIVLLAILLLVLFTLRKYNKSKQKGYFSIKSHYYYFRPDEWEVKRENLIIGERIGSGCFAEVHEGKLKIEKTNTTVDCAIKFCGSDHQSRQRLLKEANMMKSINTTHIVKMLGLISRDNPAYLILEFMEKGDLKEYLRNLKSSSSDWIIEPPLSVERFCRMAAEIADGMLWLSEHKYIHRDLAARNCLISAQDVIKIADLGLSKDIYQNPVYREKCKALLPIRWMSPESLLDGSSTTKSDVWSYGVVIWELATYGDNPYNGKENEEVIEFVKSGGRLELPKTAPNKFQVIFEKCMISKEHDRASFKEILDILDPDLSAQFKQTSYYHNDFRTKICESSRKNSVSNPLANNNVNEILASIKILEPFIGNSDNYM